ncbi:7-carboxy-7-deazaguanine synthase QueE [Vulcanisaeta thermophila]|uniref:7-carboxy-7-deazaguanine synthase QueE n=1 Tax=Vulcanisaeta thermophila TaxID=867917 RepID=UPI0009FE5651|nr:7-carboxy-7-deazaguanine synthase QueE [Vulcanisaeta thermophila]
MRVVEVFRSRQGEGPHMGEEAVFIRLAYCNLYCSWCDTKYSWHPEKAIKLGFKVETPRTMELTVDGAINLITSVGDGVNHTVITGGEPLLWKRELIELTSRLRGMGWLIEVETNGTISPRGLEGTVDEFNVSIKLAHSGVPRRIRINEGVIKEFVNLNNSIFKFVVNSWDDYDEILELITHFKIPRDRVYLMSQCTTREECTVKDGQLTKPMAKKLGVNHTPRLHIIMGFK